MDRQEKVVCAFCGAIHEVKAYSHIDVSTSPELKARVLDGTLFTWECPSCGKVNLARYPLLYHDPDASLMIILSDARLNAEELPEGYTARQVCSVGDLIEKVRIFDAGLDDIVIEMCKYVTLQETGRDLALRFVKLDGADGEMTFTYPDKGRMEMLVLGFNVYEDCAGILRRNPSILNDVSGLARIDAEWLRKFFG